ncbi:platelet glycoprotein Ib alpha chain-like [Anopheles aquasalis]|uniref:platelet glycoprotein Ib alpha chain-like n=1 Tax=Anopheles aquasalis TaxID=42839 RepID=UPI00215B5BE6|nr:platelet glycoprotein Ib alpha chain-like [Anopheles aquasalis]
MEFFRAVFCFVCLLVSPVVASFSCLESAKGYCVVENVTEPYDSFPAGQTAIWIRNSTLPSINRTLFERLPNVENLMIHRLQIAHLTLDGCPALDTLFASYNAIERIDVIPEGLPLRQLHLYQNRLTDIEPLQKLTSLEQLYLHENRLETLHFSVFAPLEQLKILTLQRNRLKRIFTSMVNDGGPLVMPRLEQLFLQFNLLPFLDTGLWRMDRLRVLDVSHNQLGYLFTFLEELPALRSLELHHNPWNCGWLYGMVERMKARAIATTGDTADCPPEGGEGAVILVDEMCCRENASSPDPVLLLVSRTAIVDELQHRVRDAKKQIDELEETQRKQRHQFQELAGRLASLETLCTTGKVPKK